MITYKISPSDLTFTWKACKYCFYMKVKHNIVATSPFPGIFTRMANQTSAFYDGQPTSALSPALPPGRIAYRERHVRSSPISFPGTESTAYIKGRFDAVIAFDDGSYGIVDYKTSDAREEDLAFYAYQLAAYAHALEHPESGALQLAPISRLGLFVVTPERYERSPRGEMVFVNRTTWTDVPRDDAALFALLAEVVALLDAPQPPLPDETCGLCSYRLAMKDAGQC